MAMIRYVVFVLLVMSWLGSTTGDIEPTVLRHWFYDNSFIASDERQDIYRTFYDSQVKMIATNAKESVKKLDVDIKFNRSILLLTKKRKYTVSSFPANVERIFQNTTPVVSQYGILRSSRDNGWSPDNYNFCPTDGGQVDNVQCSFQGNDIIVCEDKIKMETEQNIISVIVLKTVYYNFTTPYNASKCVYQNRTILHIYNGNSAENYTNSGKVKGVTRNLITKYLTDVINPFEEIYIIAKLDHLSKSTIDIRGDCSSNRSSATCNVMLRKDRRTRWNDIIRTTCLLLHSSLSPLFENEVNKDGDMQTFRKQVTSPYFMYWNELQNLDLKGNNLKDFEPQYIQEVPNLVSLDLSDNNLRTLPQEISYLKKLRKIDLSNNPLLEITSVAVALSSLRNIHELDISGVAITNIESLQPILASNYLKILRLKRASLNSLSGEIAQEMFRNQTNLIYIDLSNNKINCIPRNLFSELNNLKFLFLSSVGLSNNPSLHLNDNANVDILDLSDNKLSDLSNIIVSGKVNKLILSNNRIATWIDCEVFMSSTRNKGARIRHFIEESAWLKKLNLAHNRITGMNSEMLKSLEVLESIDLSGNPFDCMDCRTKQFKDWLNADRLKTVIFDEGVPSHVVCFRPSRWYNVPVKDIGEESRFCTQAPIHLYWLLLLPVGLLVFVTISFILLIHKNKFRVEYLKHLDESRNENRQKAIKLQDQYFENDIFLVAAPEDKEWTERNVLPRLESNTHRYKLLVADPEVKEVENFDANIDNSRHVLFIISNSFRDYKHCTRILQRVNFKNMMDTPHNLVFLMREEVDKPRLATSIKFLSATHDTVDWPPYDEPQDKFWKKLITILGPSNSVHFRNYDKQSQV